MSINGLVWYCIYACLQAKSEWNNTGNFIPRRLAPPRPQTSFYNTPAPSSNLYNSSGSNDYSRAQTAPSPYPPQRLPSSSAMYHPTPPVGMYSHQGGGSTGPGGPFKHLYPSAGDPSLNKANTSQQPQQHHHQQQQQQVKGRESLVYILLRAYLLLFYT